MDREGRRPESGTPVCCGRRRPRVLAVAVQKGGTGKTTLAASLAVAAAEAGERVVALDLDPQGSLACWGAMRTRASVTVDRLRPWEIAQLPEILAQYGDDGTTLAVIDTAGATTGMTASLRIADLVLMPVRPSRLDLVASRPTLQALVDLGMREKLAFVLNQCPPPPSPRTEAYAMQMRTLGVLAEPGIVQRVDHQDALAMGLGVTERAPEGQAAQEIRALWIWADAKIGHPPTTG